MKTKWSDNYEVNIKRVLPCTYPYFVTRCFSISLSSISSCSGYSKDWTTCIVCIGSAVWSKSTRLRSLPISGVSSMSMSMSGSVAIFSATSSGKGWDFCSRKARKAENGVIRGCSCTFDCANSCVCDSIAGSFSESWSCTDYDSGAWALIDCYFRNSATRCLASATRSLSSFC